LKIPFKRLLNSELTTEVGRPVVSLEVVRVSEGSTLEFAIASTSGTWRQGIWLGVHGELDVAGERGDQFVIWTDTAPKSFQVRVAKTEDGLLRFHNVWDSGRGRKMESLSATSGMLVDEGDGLVTYRCNDIGLSPKFDRLVFELRRELSTAPPG
jgi:hypothetical protein